MDRGNLSVAAVLSEATWTVKIERLAIQLAVGVHCDEREPQPIWVSLTLEGLASVAPDTLSDCIDYEPLYCWLTQRWPLTSHTPLLETRLNELLKFSFDFDPRVNKVRAGLYKQRVSLNAVVVGIERAATRVEFGAQQKFLARGLEIQHATAID